MNSKRSSLLAKVLLLACAVYMQACAITTASLPSEQQVPPTEPLGYDGVWIISIINKRVRFDSGRAIVIDPWIHWGAAVNEGHVALINMRDNGQGELLANDLLNGGSSWRGVLNANGHMNVTIETPIPIKFDMIPVSLTYPEYINDAVASLGGTGYSVTRATAPLAPASPPAAPSSGDDSEYAPDHDDAPAAPAAQSDPFAGCINLVVDPSTDQQVCLD
ncbi:MAG: hypothetical protein KTR32_16650 [Granulosicoccus sp.]|nr:hypothetical protein [Granulosicoccus sp.]